MKESLHIFSIYLGDNSLFTCIDAEYPIKIEEIKCEAGCKYGSCIACDGCFLDKCIPYGTRKSGGYCDLTNEFLAQKDNEETCDNNYECKSNLCINDSCVSQSLIQKILDWFKQLFGA